MCTPREMPSIRLSLSHGKKVPMETGLEVGDLLLPNVVLRRKCLSFIIQVLCLSFTKL